MRRRRPLSPLFSWLDDDWRREVDRQCLGLVLALSFLATLLYYLDTH